MVGCRAAAKRNCLGGFCPGWSRLWKAPDDRDRQGWVKSSIGWAIKSNSYSENSCIYWSSQMRPYIYGVLAELVGKFLGDLEYYELPSISP